MDDNTRQMLSSLLGYSSIVAWLCAQIPQVRENYKRGNVEALALPFLVSWLSGDVTNLIGCILTHQLPFQTYLATWFVGVDVVLVSQYVYYSRKNPKVSLPPLSEAFPYAQAPEVYHSHSRHRSTHRKEKRRRKTSSKYKRGQSGSEAEDPMAQSWMSSTSSILRSPATTRPTNSRRSTKVLPSRQASSQQLARSETVDSLASSEPPSPVLDEPRGRTLTRPSRVVPPMLETISGSPASGSPVPASLQAHFDRRAEIEAAHAAHQRQSQYQQHYQHYHGQQAQTQRSNSSSSRSRPPHPTRRTSMLFLSVGVLLTFSSMSNRPTTPQVDAVDTDAIAWSVSSPSMPVSPMPLASSATLHPPLLSWSPSSTSKLRKRQLEGSGVLPGDEHDSEPKHPGHEEPPRQHGRDWERFIGRASAWLCTTLYLTSRLPQIWQNFRRRSVEGLSMMLFIMAATGNSLYTASILTSPNASAPGYLLESLPYLLGAGGTLAFDGTIVLQSFLYSEKRRLAERERRQKGRFALHAEEEAALLQQSDGDAVEDEDDETEDATDAGSTAGARSRSVSRAPSLRSLPRGTRRYVGRSNSTEMNDRPSRSRSSTKRDISTLLEDRPFDWTVNDLYSSRDSSTDGRTISGATSRSRTRPSSVVSAGGLNNIPEGGESTVTIR
ncbi:hypothetical protein ACM66B_005067 [Microbotryomycetes sp. NB124-2]